MPTDKPTPQAVDYSNRPLTEGDTVAFISTDPVGLTPGRIVLIRERQICIESGHLVILQGNEGLFGNDGRVKFFQIALQPECDA